MSVTGGSPSPASFAGAESPGTTVTINANTAYSVGEWPVGEYSRGDLRRPARANRPSARARVPPARSPMTTGGPSTVIKHVINNNGGTALGLA